MSNIYEVRNIYQGLRNTQTHLVQSTEIATACTCQHLFKLSYPYGVVIGDRDYIVANTVHDIMSLAIIGPIIDNWEYKAKDHQLIINSIMRDSSSIIEKIIHDKKELAKNEGNQIAITFDEDVNDRFRGLLFGFVKRLMQKYYRPKKAISEITLSNIQKFHEGRIDALLEYPHSYGLIDWKTYNLNPANSSGHEKWQLLSNSLLANHRYKGNEDDWTEYDFSSIIYYEGAYIPRLINPVHIQRIKEARNFAQNVLCGIQVQAQKPSFCAVCDAKRDGNTECNFYRRDSQLSSNGFLPAVYDQIRRQIYGTRYRILRERAETHIHKFVLSLMCDKYGEKKAIEELENAGILHTGYKYVSDDEQNVVFQRNSTDTFLEPKKIIRVIGKENGIPLLSCISEEGTVLDATEDNLIMDFRSKVSVKRAKKQLFNLPIIMLRDEINLTKRLLSTLHKLHKLAGDIFIPNEDFENDFKS